MGKLHDVTGGFAVPTYMLASCMVIGIILTLTFKDHGKLSMSLSFHSSGLCTAFHNLPKVSSYLSRSLCLMLQFLFLLKFGELLPLTSEMQDIHFADIVFQGWPKIQCI